MLQYSSLNHHRYSRARAATAVVIQSDHSVGSRKNSRIALVTQIETVKLHSGQKIRCLYIYKKSNNIIVLLITNRLNQDILDNVLLCFWQNHGYNKKGAYYVKEGIIIMLYIFLCNFTSCKKWLFVKMRLFFRTFFLNWVQFDYCVFFFFFFKSTKNSCVILPIAIIIIVQWYFRNCEYLSRTSHTIMTI